MPVAAGHEQHMGQNLTELIERHRALSGKLEQLVSSIDNIPDAELSDLDAQLTENLEQILTAQSLNESDLFVRIEFVSDLIYARTAGLVSLDRELSLLHDDYENIIRLHRRPKAASENNI